MTPFKACRSHLQRAFCLALILALLPTAVALAGPSPQSSGGDYTLFLPSLTHNCNLNVAVLIDSTLLAEQNATLRGSLDLWYADMCGVGYHAIEQVVSATDPMQVRAQLVALNAQSPLEGAILVGNIPYAWQLVTWPAGDTTPAVDYQVPTYEIYNDLDGVFSLSPDYSLNHPPYFYNQHTGTTDWELWIGVLPMYHNVSAPADAVRASIEAINGYLAKNHAYRTGKYTLGKDYMTFEENYGDVNDMYLPYYLEWLKTGDGSWMPLSNSPTARLYMRVNDPAMAKKLGYTSDTYKSDLSAGLADFFVHFGHGAPNGMGDLTIDYIKSHPINTAWYIAGGCDVGDPRFDNYLTEMIYHPNSQVVLAQGDMGVGGNLVMFNVGEKYSDHVASALAAKRPLGPAMVEFANGTRDPNEFQMPLLQSLATFGDPTLTLVR